MSEIPPELSYTSEHEWVRRVGDDTVRVGITDFAQSSLGDVVFVQLPDAGADVTDLYSPVTAKVVAVNGDLESSPQLVNSDPYGEGWLIELRADADSLEDGLRGLLSADAYQALVTE